jgi:F0F1-type ATP synthase assembly protein I
MKHKEYFDSFFYIGELGLIMVISTICGLGAGIFLDKFFKTKFLVFIFLILGVVGGFIGIYKTVTRDEGLKK